MSNECRVRVALYWGGDVIYESNTVRYSRGVCTVVKLSLNVEYDWLVRNLHIRMKTNPNKIRLVILGQWLFSTVQGNAPYSKISIVDNETLQEFMVAPNTMRYMVNLDLLEMYIKTETLDVVEPTHNLNSLSLNFATPSLNHNEPPSNFYEPSTNMTSNFSKFQSFTSFLSQSITPRVDIPSGNYSHGCTDFGANFDIDNYRHYDFRDGAGTSNLPQVPEISRVSEIQAANTHANDNSDNNSPNDAYQSDEMSEYGDDNDDDQQPAIEVPQNIPFHRENIPFMNDLQDHPEVFASTHESESVGCKVWLNNKESNLKYGKLFPSKERLKTDVKI
ncbi:hypothetical protein FXO38_26582 [Capsicum annuum]|nr:hypothetical protein FXO38_26582 [Capsicum annuum]KAF3633865.1 hypothetical protein FXO37_26823 [Capsicum annuum]